jgi:hypothetical protein
MEVETLLVSFNMEKAYHNRKQITLGGGNRVLNKKQTRSLLGRWIVGIGQPENTCRPTNFVIYFTHLLGGKKNVFCRLGLLSTIMRERERSDQESAIHGKIALANEHN